jgi:hypothetical protein
VRVRVGGGLVGELPLDYGMDGEGKSGKGGRGAGNEEKDEETWAVSFFFWICYEIPTRARNEGQSMNSWIVPSAAWAEHGWRNWANILAGT